MTQSDTRCGRCGRTPGDVSPRMGPIRGSVAPALMPSPDTSPDPQWEQPSNRPPRSRPEVRSQGDLFDGRPVGNIIPFPGAPPAGSKRKAGGPKGPSRSKPKKPSPPALEGQGSLDFVQAPPSRPLLGTTVEARVCCEYPVAARVHRMLAAGVDSSIIALGYAMYLAASRFVPAAASYPTAPFAADRAGLISLVVGLGLMAFAYGVTCVIAGRDSVGMDCLGLELRTLYGEIPDRGQRMARFLGSCLAAATGVGLLWCIADEERLTWADHISGTFPTPRSLQRPVLGGR